MSLFLGLCVSSYLYYLYSHDISAEECHKDIISSLNNFVEQSNMYLPYWRTFNPLAQAFKAVLLYRQET